jgi:hypothetical protein
LVFVYLEQGACPEDLAAKHWHYSDKQARLPESMVTGLEIFFPTGKFLANQHI